MNKGYLFEKYGNAYFIVSVMATLLGITASMRLFFKVRKEEILLDLEEERLRNTLKN